MVTARTWTIKGVSDGTRDAVYDTAQATGLTIGEWIDRALAQAAEEALHPKPPAATREDVAEVVREQLAPILTRLEALEGKTGQAAKARAPIKRADVGPARAVVRGEAPERPRRKLTEEVQARIEELHRAGRSAYAISKELGVSYGTVRARVKALAAAQPEEPSTNTPHAHGNCSPCLAS
jgi:DNA-binding NarL/FixJ family response regulator